MHVFPFTKQIQSFVLLKKYCENKVKIKMTCSVVNTILQNNIGKHIMRTRSLMKTQYTTSKKRTQYQTTKFEINQIPTKKRENKLANRGKITNFH